MEYVRLVGRLRVRVSSISASGIVEGVKVAYYPGAYVGRLGGVRELPSEATEGVNVSSFTGEGKRACNDIVMSRSANRVLRLVSSESSSVITGILGRCGGISAVAHSEKQYFVGTVGRKTPSTRTVASGFRIVRSLADTIFPGVLRRFLRGEVRLLARNLINPVGPRVDENQLCADVCTILRSVYGSTEEVGGVTR